MVKVKAVRDCFVGNIYRHAGSVFDIEPRYVQEGGPLVNLEREKPTAKPKKTGTSAKASKAHAEKLVDEAKKKAADK